MGAGATTVMGVPGSCKPNHRQAVIADEGDRFAVGRELGIVAGSRAGKADLHAGAVVQVVEPEPAVGVEEQVRGVGRPQVAGHLVALAMVAVLLRAGAAGERSHLGAAHHHVRLAGAGIQIHQFAAIEIGQVLSVGRPGERLGRTCQSAGRARRWPPR